MPAEHGSWGLVIEPLVLGLLVAPSPAGACLSLGAFAAFLARRPFKVALGERQQQRSGRSRVAWLFVLLYGATAVLGFASTVPLVGSRPLLPLLLGSPLLVLFLAYDLRNQSRNWQAQIAGAVIFAMVTAGITLAGKWSAAPAFALATVLVARAVPSILYVRSRLRLDRNRPHGRPVVLVAHTVALAVVVVLVRADLLPWLATVPFLVLLARAAVGLSGYRRPIAIKTIGLTEMGYGALTVLVLAIGYWTGV